EFRAPLSVISVAAENLLLLQSENANNIRVRATRIRRTVKRMSFLIDNVLADDQLSGSRAQSDTIDVFDLNEILGAVKAGLDDDAIHRVGFRLDKSVMVRANRILLEIALQNLIQNALKYSPE